MPKTRLIRAGYRHFDTFATRWRDNDAYGHMNNAVFIEYADTVVNGWLVRSGGLEVPGGPVIALVAGIECSYFASLGFPVPVETGLRLAEAGTTSVSYDVGFFAPGEEMEAARARFTHVCVDARTRHPVAIPEKLRAALHGLVN